MTEVQPSALTRAEAVDVLLADGSIGQVRAVVPADREALDGLHEGISADDLRLRFFSLNRAAGHLYVDQVLAGCDGGRCLALGLWRGRDLLGLATAELLGDHTAEISFLVADAHHGLGIGTLLLEHLAALAQEAGIGRFTADVLVDNHAMLDVLRSAGFAIARHTEGGVVTVEMDTTSSAESLLAADEREARAEAASLAALLRPRRVAVAGVRRDGSGIGAAILDSILGGGFRGEVVAVHPVGDVGAGVATYRSFDQIPEPPDLVVVAVPPTRVVDCVADAARAGSRAAVVVTSGFAEMGEAGAALQRQLTRVARQHDIRVVGPNCLGLLDNQSDVRLDATFGIASPPAGGLAIASQSGGVGIVLLDLARQLGVGVRHFVSLGNKADVSSNDLLEAWYDDPEVTAAALYLESFGSSAKFARIARRFGERKPLLAVVGGRSGSGQRAGASHTAAASTPGVRIDALFAQAGVVPCADAEDLAETALLFSEQPLPDGSRVAVVTNAGGMGVLAADAAAAERLDVPLLSAELQERLSTHVSGTVGIANPVDAGAAGSAEALGSLTEELLASAEVDAVLLIVVRTRTLAWDEVRAALAAARAEHPEKPLVAVLLGGIEAATIAGATSLPSVTSALRALGHAARYAAWRRAPRVAAPPSDSRRAAAARAWAREQLESSGPGWLGPAEAVELLAPYGLSPVGTMVRGAVEAARAAARIGFPVAVKVADPDVVHKTELGLVRTALASEDEVAQAAEDFARLTGRPDVQLLVQPMVSGVELALGVTRDPGLGPLVMVAAGGTATELLQDRVLLLAPVTELDAEQALRALRMWPLLTGYRGATPADVRALVEAVVGLGALAHDVPELAEMDLNPIVALANGVAAVDVKVRIAPAAVVDTGVPRRLRMPG